MKSIITSLSLMLAGACAHAGIVPESWYQLPENQHNFQGIASSAPDEQKLSGKQKEALDSLVDRIVQSDAEQLDKLNDMQSSLPAPDPSKPADWVPWHAEYFVTDLGISTSGLLGALTAKGTPAVQVFWRRQNEAAKKPTEAEAPQAVSLSSSSSPREISEQLEPAIRAAMASGKVHDESTLRRNMREAAERFQSIASTLDNDHGHPWWPSRFRLDVTIDASGKVYFVNVGGEIKFRFDWHRLARKGNAPLARHPLTAADSAMKTNLEGFVRAVASDLETLSEGPITNKGLQAYLFRVGVGATAKGTVGVVTGSTSVLGQIYFNRDVKKPVVNPPQGLVDQGSDGPGTIAIIEDAPKGEHLRFADANGIVAERDGMDSVVYRIDRAKFRKGLEKAFRLGGYFADRALASSKTSRKWKLFELRADYDLSLTGTVGVATVGGLVSAEVCFWNTNF